ncbi:MULTISPECIES: type II TA system antitoxin MqsA family protein [Stenotrophomonas]|uniref:type II TA system antitoxin MqsA family protein n=1 Tax=Stenotrophomonas TaxID=40323 RepID=UPI000EB5E2EF|nr:type II TA system antitoxin MqsA family protein [Stenotrophomonas sp. SMYL86]HEL3172291.1 type II toxin-antitoxin system MqsA family antitoxin [Stenotrophomonas maltophilia]HEL5042147.1 type II toxin-antitoxin system MqsA family antitoxin [Stenotrophomonas maltophilia]
MNKATSRLCPACEQAPLVASTRERHFTPRGNPVVVELLAMECPACGATATSAAQQIENLRRLAARRAHYGGLLLGEDVLAFRRRYGLTQRAAATLFGKGAIAFSRYENETTYPDDATTMLLSLAMEKPEVVRWLAERTGTAVPLLDRLQDVATKPPRRVSRAHRVAPGTPTGPVRAVR